MFSNRKEQTARQQVVALSVRAANVQLLFDGLGEQTRATVEQYLQLANDEFSVMRLYGLDSKFGRAYIARAELQIEVAEAVAAACYQQ